MRARDHVRLRTLRMALTSITNEEVAGASARDLSDEEIVKVLTREARKRREAAEALGAAGRAEQAAAERADGAVLARYLPAQLRDGELAAPVGAAVAVAVAFLRLLRLLDHLAVALAPERTVQRNRLEVGDLAEGGVVERHVPGRPGRVRPEHLGRARLAAALQPVAGGVAGHRPAG